MGWLLTGRVNLVLYSEAECKSCHQMTSGSAFFSVWVILFLFFLVSQFKRSLTYYAELSSIWRDSLTSNIIRNPGGDVSWPLSR